MKKIFYALVGIVMAICLAGCGNESDSVSVSSVMEENREVEETQEEPEAEEELEAEESEPEEEAPAEEADMEADAEEDADAADVESYLTLEDYLNNNPAVKAEMDAGIEAQSSDQLSITWEVKDNEFTLIYKFGDSVVPVEGESEALLDGLDSLADVSEATAKQFDEGIGQKGACTVVIRYIDSDGNVLAEKSYAANEEEPEAEEDSSTGGYSEGCLGDTMETCFFDYTVNSAYLCEAYNGYQPADGNCLLVAEVTVKNTFHESIEMYDTDFQIQWNSDGPDDYDYPITNYTEPVSDEQLESTYELSINEEVTGLLVFEVPAGKKDFSISYLELFDDDSEGDVYFVYFTAQMQ